MNAKVERSSWVKNLSDANIDVRENIDLTSFSTMRLRSRGDLVVVRSINELLITVQTFKKENMSYSVLGWGANQPLPERATAPYIKLDFEFDRTNLNEVRPSYVLPASVSLATLVSAAGRLGLSGWDVLAGIPASLGGAVAMNAGTSLGEIGTLVDKVWYITKEGKKVERDLSEKDFSYRSNKFLELGDIIYQVRLKHNGIDPKIASKIRDYLKYRNSSQPMSAWTCGCMFKNHVAGVTCRAGEYIDIMGLKGLRYKDLRISPKHANFLENTGDSTLEDVKEFIGFIQDQLLNNFGIKFEPEIKI